MNLVSCSFQEIFKCCLIFKNHNPLPWQSASHEGSIIPLSCRGPLTAAELQSWLIGDDPPLRLHLQFWKILPRGLHRDRSARQPISQRGDCHETDN